MFDEQAERALILEETGPQQSRMKAGITRAMAQRFYSRRDAAQAARLQHYSDGQSIAQTIDNLLESGYTEVEPLPAGRLKLCKGDNSVILARRIETDYARIMLNLAPLAQTY